MSIFVRVILVEEGSAQKDKNIVPALKTWGYFVERWFRDWRICFKKHPNFDLSCKRRYFEHPAILVQTLPLEGPWGFLGQFMHMYTMEYVLLIGLNLIEDTTCLVTLFCQWDTTECPYHFGNPPLHPNLYFLIQSCWWWWMWIAV